MRPSPHLTAPGRPPETWIGGSHPSRWEDHGHCQSCLRRRTASSSCAPRRFAHSPFEIRFDVPDDLVPPGPGPAQPRFESFHARTGERLHGEAHRRRRGIAAAGRCRRATGLNSDSGCATSRFLFGLKARPNHVIALAVARREVGSEVLRPMGEGHLSALFSSWSAIQWSDIASGAQTNRRGNARPVRNLLDG